MSKFYGTVRDDKNLADEIQIDDTLYMVTYDVFIWRSADDCVQDEIGVEVTNTVPYLDDDSDEMKIIISEIAEKEL